ncbi:MAG TPA: hypothetical protein VF510_17060 [Ktedonobacterales bacterium]
MLQLDRSSRPLACAVPLLVLLLSGCTSSVPPTPTATAVQTEPAFLSTQIAVSAPEQVHPGDPISVIVGLEPMYQSNAPSHKESYEIALYGRFPSRAELQSAITAGTVDAPPRRNLTPGEGGGGGGNGSGLTMQNNFSLPQSLAPGTYDLVVTVRLTGSRATARSDTPLLITAK